LIHQKSRNFQIIIAKLEILETKIKEAKNNKFKYTMRDMTVISKKGIIYYDKNGNRLPPKKSNERMFNEIRKLDENPPKYENKISDSNVWIEINYKKLKEMKQEIYKKYNYIPPNEEIKEKNTYSWNTYLQSL
jgi:hypothetical protein